MSGVADLPPRLAKVVALVQEHHGVGARSDHVPAWMLQRLERALDEMATRGQVSVDELVRQLSGDAEAVAKLADVLRVGETRFYRDPQQWEVLRTHVLPRLGEGGRIRALSVGCSTGEEAWTLAMVLERASAMTAPAAQFRVVGMDRSELALSTARAGAYPAEVVERLPVDLRDRFLEEQADSYRVRDGLRARVGFVQRDLMDGPPPGAYELIICRNVLIYFSDDAFDQAATTLLGALTENGILLVARSEVSRLRALGTAVELGPSVTGFSA